MMLAPETTNGLLTCLLLFTSALFQNIAKPYTPLKCAAFASWVGVIIYTDYRLNVRGEQRIWKEHIQQLEVKELMDDILDERDAACAQRDGNDNEEDLLVGENVDARMEKNADHGGDANVEKENNNADGEGSQPRSDLIGPAEGV